MEKLCLHYWDMSYLSIYWIEHVPPTDALKGHAIKLKWLKKTFIDPLVNNTLEPLVDGCSSTYGAIQHIGRFLLAHLFVAHLARSWLEWCITREMRVWNLHVLFYTDEITPILYDFVFLLVLPINGWLVIGKGLINMKKLCLHLLGLVLPIDMLNGHATKLKWPKEEVFWLTHQYVWNNATDRFRMCCSWQCKPLTYGIFWIFLRLLNFLIFLQVIFKKNELVNIEVDLKCHDLH
jgi:hypothetical protein